MPPHMHKSGFTLVEVVLSIMLLSLFVLMFIGIAVYVQSQSFMMLRREQALFLAEEGLDATRSIRNTNFSSLSDGSHGLMKDENVWEFSGEEEAIEDYRRAISIETMDLGIKKITSSISWTEQGEIITISLTSILTDSR